MTGRLRVAIVGVGPKGLFALERLLHHAPDVVVELFEPHPFPGAGPVYDPRQPAYLRMNFAASQVDLWPPGTRAVAAADRTSFTEWSAANGGSGDEYPPRAEVGDYLGAGLAALRRHGATRAGVTLLRERVRRVVRDGGRWSVTTPTAERTYDEVLLATGHAPPPVAERLDAWSHAAPLVPAVYPAERLLAQDAIPAGAVVAVRGFALTFLDAALALTEGRGASFVPLAHPWRLRYVPAGDAVRAILPFSRTGRPMLAKPAPSFADDDVLRTAAARGAARIRALPAPVALRRDVLPALDEVAAASGAAGAVRGGACASIARSLDVACGLAPPDGAWARGQAWRALYPAIVERLGGEGLQPADWPEFLHLAAEMERLAFGPPVVNAARLLALVEAGVVDLAHVRGGGLVDRGATTALRSAQGETPIDVVVDAVLPGPGVVGAGPAAGLVADGSARIAPGRRGLDVCDDGTCRALDGSRSEGLAAIGRPTEDAVIGNDTLSRTLHPLADGWACRVASRARDGVASWSRGGVPA